uniref:Uncharacterized protein n=1 Tax=Meloidogyne enterolobii TaxID=390850 RepID=A0A6V7UAY6_MELEN|nr:unnamed protein product [Meloidogyne enterolobii]
MAGRRCFDRALHGGMWWPWLDGINQTLCLWWWLACSWRWLVVGVLLAMVGGWRALAMVGGWRALGGLHALGGVGGLWSGSTSGMDGMDKAECAPLDGISFWRFPSSLGKGGSFTGKSPRGQRAFIDFLYLIVLPCFYRFYFWHSV